MSYSRQFIFSICSVLAGLAGLPLTLDDQDGDELPIVRVVLVEDRASANSADSVEAVRRELRERSRGVVELQFPANLKRVADGTKAGVEQVLDDLDKSAELEFLIAVGPIGSELLCRRSEHKIPSIGMLVIDAELQNAPFGGPGSGIRNLNYLAEPLNLLSDIAAYRELVSFESVELVFEPQFARTVPGLIEAIRAELERAGLRVGLHQAGESVDAILAELPSAAEAVMLAPLVQFSAEENEQFVAELRSRQLPSFALLGADAVRRGLLVSSAHETGFESRAKRVAQNVMRIIRGESAGDLPISEGGEHQLTINEATVRALGIRPRFDLLVEAELVGERPASAPPTLRLAQVIRDALTVDLNLLAAESELLSRSEAITQARASLLPQLDLLASWTLIDDDQASLGRAERSLTGRLSGSQVLYSEGLGARVEVEESLHESRESDLLVKELDVVEVAALAYINVLRAQSLFRVQRQDLRLSRSNLALAATRNELGLSGPAEVHRWESSIATGRRSVLDAQSSLRIAELEVNRVLNRDLGQSFQTEEVGIGGPGELVDSRLARFIENPRDFEVFRAYQIQKGMEHSPELASLDSAIRAQERALASTRRAHWRPIISLDGSIVDVLSAEGTGSQVPPGFAGIIPDPEMTTWSTSLVGSFPLISGGAMNSRERQARHELVRLRYLRAASSQLTEQRIRIRLQSAVASFAGIRLAERAADFARKNLELVVDSYSNGILSIIDVLEAQRALLIAKESAIGATYDFAADIIGLQRAVGRFSILASDGERDLWFEELERFAAGYRPELSR